MHKLNILGMQKMAANKQKVILGQEAICPHGLGRVLAFELWNGKVQNIQVQTYVHDHSCMWSADNVELIDPRRCNC